MFHRIRNVYPLQNLELCVQFMEGVTKIYDVKPLLDKWDAFKDLENPELFHSVYVALGGMGIIWNENIDLSCDSLWEDGKTVVTPFDKLMAFSDATTLWNLNESTLRKAIAYGRFIEGIDVCKFGKQWVITMDAMCREYGDPPDD